MIKGNFAFLTTSYRPLCIWFISQESILVASWFFPNLKFIMLWTIKGLAWGLRTKHIDKREMRNSASVDY